MPRDRVRVPPPLLPQLHVDIFLCCLCVWISLYRVLSYAGTAQPPSEDCNVHFLFRFQLDAFFFFSSRKTPLAPSSQHTDTASYCSLMLLASKLLYVCVCVCLCVIVHVRGWKCAMDMLPRQLELGVFLFGSAGFFSQKPRVWSHRSCTSDNGRKE